MKMAQLLVAAIVAVVVIAPAARADDGAAGRRVAALPAAGNAPVALRDAVDGAVLDALGGIAGLRVQPVAETRAVLSTMQGLGLACDPRIDRDRCALRIGGLAGVDVVVASDVEQIDDVAVVRLASFDVARQRPLAATQIVRLAPTSTTPTDTTPTKSTKTRVKTTATLLPLGAGHARELGLAVIRLIAPEQERGLLAVSVEAGAAVVVDGVPRGIAPLPAPLSLPPGRHELWVGRVGRVSQTHAIDIAFGETTRLDVALEAEDDTGAAAAPLTLPVAAAAAAPSVRRIAVYDVEGANLPAHLPALAQSALTIELRKLEGVVVVSMDEIRTLIDHEAKRQLASCSDDTSCLAGIADALGADTIVTVQLAMIEGQSVYGARRLDTAGLAAATTVQERLKPDEGRELIAVCSSPRRAASASAASAPTAPSSSSPAAPSRRAVHAAPSCPASSKATACRRGASSAAMPRSTAARASPASTSTSAPTTMDSPSGRVWCARAARRTVRRTARGACRACRSPSRFATRPGRRPACSSAPSRIPPSATTAPSTGWTRPPVASSPCTMARSAPSPAPLA
jgi:hypothetical protein